MYFSLFFLRLLLLYSYCFIPARNEAADEALINVDGVNAMAPHAAFGDGRQGKFWHPQRGNLSTYVFESRVNYRHYFDERPGSWIRMPLAWERHLPEIRQKLVAIQDVLPNWTSASEMVMALRENNYDVQSTINWKIEETAAEGKMNCEVTYGVASTLQW